MTVETAIKTFFDKSVGTLSYWFGGSINADSNRSLPKNQGDDSEEITPIESLESIE